MSNRTIIHLDLDAFFCAVEELFNPSLRGKPFAVGGSPDSRGVVSSCSYAARRLGIHSALPMAQAVRLCPNLIILPGRYQEYRRKSRQVMQILRQRTELIEQISIDEAFLDVSEWADDKIALAKELQEEIRTTAALPCSLGIASNKLVAKIATDVGKASVKTNTYPNAIQFVPPGEEADFLAPLPLQTLWGIGPKTAGQLMEIGIQNIGQLAEWPVNDLVKRMGKMGYDLHKRARGVDNRPIETYREPKSVSQETTFSRDVSDKTQLLSQIEKQSQSVGKSLQKSRLLGATVKLKLRWPNFSTITRQITLPAPTNDAATIADAAKKLFQENWNGKMPIRLIGVGVSGLQPPSKQLGLWDGADYTKLAHLEAALYKLKNRFGEDSISKGIHTHNEQTHDKK
ncbi:DNA polymerase IV [bacterium]|nr:DNA polymerase IV [bacterium]